ncbi:hypothetical protein Y032_0020g41 [Ancylostoma ceylanicum]|uniref:SCP domain-containing protein n=1 Tax=Ancylostoma ceylanicum TaxID=53326 RepID=A0A016V1Q2_9BILA|nr:hypothetical protein Y032_0020g41 [Ancylostoma ceylanicum]
MAPKIRFELAGKVIAAKQQYPQEPVYDCGVEKEAYQFVRPSGQGPSPMIGSNVVYKQENGKTFNVDEVVREWKVPLQEMGNNKKRFGCNLSIVPGQYKVACVFE